MIKRQTFRKTVATITACALMLSNAVQSVLACTGITLKATDGSVVFGRTLEWGSFDLKSRLVVIPRGYKYATHTPDGKPGLSWQGKYGVVGIDAVEKDMVVEGMNEKGLAVGLFYHPGFAEYQTYDPAQAAQSMGPTDVGQYLLTTCATVDEVRAAIAKVRVVAVVEPALGFPAPVHFIITEPSGKAVIIEYLKGELVIFDAPLGVITNAPSYDWHETNLRNYINLSPVALPGKKIEDLNFKPRRRQRYDWIPWRFHAAFALRAGRSILQDGASDRDRGRNDLRGLPHPRQLRRTTRCGGRHRRRQDTRDAQRYNLDQRFRYEQPSLPLPHAA